MPAPAPNTSQLINGQLRDIRLLVLHCSASPNDRSLFSGKYGTPGWRTPATEIDAWHKARGFHRDTYWRGRQNPDLEAIGYHFLIARNGAVFTGRHEHELGAHAQGWNSVSLGICMVGTDQFTEVQWLALSANVSGLAKRYEIPLQPPKLGTANGKGLVLARGVVGHGKLPGHNKLCPGFDVAAWLAGGLKPLAGHVTEAGK